MHIPIADLHCDLLWYLANKAHRNADDPESQCSIIQMEKGGVVFQILAIFTKTKKGSSAEELPLRGICSTFGKLGFSGLYRDKFLL